MLVKEIRNLIRRFGLDIVEYPPPDIDQFTTATILAVKNYSLTSAERIFALCESVKYVVNHRIPGDIVECGVWKGGSMMAVAHTLLHLNDKNRELWLFDTFEGMAPPTKNDISVHGIPALKMLSRSNKKDPSSVWCCASLKEVKKAVFTVGYPEEKIHFIKGMVENTIPANAPAEIAILRLDTDWYESTHHALVYLFPRLSTGGVIIIDDYGYWQGARKATDDYIKENNIKLLLNRIDDTGRIAVKLPL